MLQLIRRFVGLLLLAVFVFVGITFGKLNASTVQIDYFFFSSNRSVGESLAIFFFAGLIIGALAMFTASWWTMRSRIREVRKQAADEQHQQLGSSEKQLEKPAANSSHE